jgi:hypothetical protein
MAVDQARCHQVVCGIDHPIGTSEQRLPTRLKLRWVHDVFDHAALDVDRAALNFALVVILGADAMCSVYEEFAHVMMKNE